MLQRNIDTLMHQLKPVPSPSWSLLGAEPLRALIEYASLRLKAPTVEPGDGHPVVVFPGLASDRHVMGPLMSFCRDLGYQVHDWGRGFNTGPKGDVGEWLAALASDVDLLAPSHERISLVGWSLGGVYAREIAKLLPQRVRQVVTIGTPFAGSADQTNAGLVYRLLNGQVPAVDEDPLLDLAAAPPVPTTSIYSRSDGIVAWQACIQADAESNAENVEIEGSHCGMGWNPAVLSVVADRLGQSDGHWKPYATP